MNMDNKIKFYPNSLNYYKIKINIKNILYYSWKEQKRYILYSLFHNNLIIPYYQHVLMWHTNSSRFNKELQIAIKRHYLCNIIRSVI